MSNSQDKKMLGMDANNGDNGTAQGKRHANPASTSARGTSSAQPTFFAGLGVVPPSQVPRVIHRRTTTAPSPSLEAGEWGPREPQGNESRTATRGGRAPTAGHRRSFTMPEIVVTEPSNAAPASAILPPARAGLLRPPGTTLALPTWTPPQGPPAPRPNRNLLMGLANRAKERQGRKIEDKGKEHLGKK
ncbi:uncharacterized protein RCC_08832 [Ramularia collo-cygni]|uniref:Uncharacterized protein n=1 Tax=Ramularia collo-cygni TaxID=112498 RepID=A0A2D3VDJ1_9PEZI|nr:uncharacterized protein RCC_08832 [Ramularia collo-cygni]CZT23122.1 uncharacterized protein RCC_08832 [Ramularia collo-cygni]